MTFGVRQAYDQLASACVQFSQPSPPLRLLCRLRYSHLPKKQVRGFQQPVNVRKEAREDDEREPELNHHEMHMRKVHGLFATASEETETMRIHDLKAPHVGHIKVLEMNRPKSKNALSKQLLADLSHQIEAIHEEDEAGQTRALIIASAVHNAFCAGADLKERKCMSQEETHDFVMALRATFSRLATLPIPSIAAINSFALGGGLELALCCHIRVCSPDAVLGLPETRLGIIPGAGGTYRLAQAIGRTRARELILTGRRVDANEAAAIGLCHTIANVDHAGAAIDREAPDQNSSVKHAAIALAEMISEGGPVAIKAALEAVDGGSQGAENAAYDKVLRTQDRIEALKAFAEKRKPHFTGA